MPKDRPPITAIPPPQTRLIGEFAGRAGHYTDAFQARVAGEVGLAGFLRAFYGSRLFGMERAVLRMAGYPSTAEDIEALAQGRATRFAAWRVEARSATEILLQDVSGRTRSWLAVAPTGSETLLWFGSVIAPARGRDAAGIGPVLTAFIGPHRAYSRALLRAALRNLPSV